MNRSRADNQTLTSGSLGSAQRRDDHRGLLILSRRSLPFLTCFAWVWAVCVAIPTWAVPLFIDVAARPPAPLSQLRGGPVQPLDGGGEPAGLRAEILRIASDFNGDGFADLAVGVPNEDVGATVDAGAVNVLYGSADGLEASGAQFWTQGSSGVLGRPERQDRFGYALAQGDFDGDGFTDLAIGVPREDVGLIRNAGAVNVLYGSALGLTATGNQLWAQSSPGIKDRAERWDLFGFAVAAGDFNRDRRAELAVGVPFEDLPGGVNPGAVNVLYGSGAGLRATANQFWNQNSPGIKGTANDLCGIGPFPELCERFGWALATANFGKGRAADLAIGVPGELGPVPGYPFGAGAVNVIYGKSGTGLTASGNQRWSQGTPGVKGDPGFCDPGSGCAVEFFGSALAAANFGKSAYADLAIGVPGDGISPEGFQQGPGGVNVLYGSSNGLVVAGNQLWNQDSPDVLDEAEDFDHFGAALAAGNFGNGFHADLAVGVPAESFEGIDAAGGVNVLYGSTTGLSATGNQFWTQDSPEVADAAEENDVFGAALFAGSFGYGAERDLAIGVPREGLEGTTEVGAANLLFGSMSGLSASGNEFWHQDGEQVRDSPEGRDHFGRSLG
jgi:FG-GAP repeat